MLKFGVRKGVVLAAAAFLSLAVGPFVETAAVAKSFLGSGSKTAKAGTKTAKGGNAASRRRQTSKVAGGGAGSAKSTQYQSSYRTRGKASRWSRRGVVPVVVATPPTILPVAVRPAVAAVSVQAAPISAQAFIPLAVGGITSTSARMASDLASVLDSDSLRVLPVMTRSSLPDVLALAQADKADLAFLHGDLLATLPPAQRASFASRIAYVARLYNEEVHVIAGRDINDIRELAGKKVNVGSEGSANAQTAELIFERLGIAPIIVHIDQPTALAQLATGDLVADVLVSGRPVRALQDFAGDGHFKLLSVPYEAALQDIYLPARIEGVDYGNLVPPGRTVETLAVPIVLATFDSTPGSPRAARMARFTDALFTRVEALRDPARHPKWREVNLAANVSGWTRFAAAQDAIDRSSARAPSNAATSLDPARQALGVDDLRLYGQFQRGDKAQ